MKLARILDSMKRRKEATLTQLLCAFLGRLPFLNVKSLFTEAVVEASKHCRAE